MGNFALFFVIFLHVLVSEDDQGWDGGGGIPLYLLLKELKPYSQVCKFSDSHQGDPMIP